MADVLPASKKKAAKTAILIDEEGYALGTRSNPVVLAAGAVASGNTNPLTDPGIWDPNQFQF